MSETETFRWNDAANLDDAQTALNKRVNSMLIQGIRNHRRWQGIYRDGLRYVFNDQLHDKQVKEGWEGIQINYLFPAMMQEQALLAQRRHNIIAKPWEPDDEEGAKVWNKALQWTFKSYKLKRLLANAIIDGKTHGHMIVKVNWENEAQYNAETEEYDGDLKYTLIRPEYFGCDPDAENIKDALFVYTFRMEHTESLISRFPQHREAIMTAAQQATALMLPWEQYGRTGQVPDTSHEFIDLDTEAVRGEPGELPKGGKRARLADNIRPKRRGLLLAGTEGAKYAASLPILEMWFKDYTTIKRRRKSRIAIETLMEEGRVVQRRAEPTSRLQNYLAESDQLLTNANWPATALDTIIPKYPNGRHVIRVGDNTVLWDKPWRYEKWPFAIGVNMLLPHTWHGLNATEMAVGLQDFMNESASHLLNYVKFFGDPTWIVEQGAVAGVAAGEDISAKMRAAAGAVLVVESGAIDKVKRETPPSLSRGVLQIIELFAREIKTQTGVQDVTLGRKAQGQTTATEVLTMETYTKLRTSLQSMLLDDFIIEIMELTHMLCREHWEPEDLLRVVGRSGMRNVTVDPRTMDAKFDLELEVTTQLPFDRDRKKNEMTELFGLLAPYGFELALLPRLLEAFEIEDVEEIMQQSPIAQEFMQMLQERQEAAEAAEGEGQSQAQPEPEVAR